MNFPGLEILVAVDPEERSDLLPGPQEVPLVLMWHKWEIQIPVPTSPAEPMPARCSDLMGMLLLKAMTFD